MVPCLATGAIPTLPKHKICLEAGVNLFDTADVYSSGASEEILGEAIKGKRDQLMISTKITLPMPDLRSMKSTYTM
jgi:aryl-alcohol dehydrogenase-like predicted oxidoreductase